MSLLLSPLELLNSPLLSEFFTLLVDLRVSLLGCDVHADNPLLSLLDIRCVEEVEQRVHGHVDVTGTKEVRSHMRDRAVGIPMEGRHTRH